MSTVIKSNDDLRSVVLETLDGVRKGTVSPKVGATIARLSNVALQSGIASAQLGGDDGFFKKGK